MHCVPLPVQVSSDLQEDQAKRGGHKHTGTFLFLMCFLWCVCVQLAGVPYVPAHVIRKDVSTTER
jgi:hypothetical protein